MGVPYQIARKVSHDALRKLARSSDVLMQNMISLRSLPALRLAGKPIVVTHQSWMRRHDGSLGLENHFKRLATRFCHNVSISQSIANSLPVKSQVIGNPFEVAEFEPLRKLSKDRDIVFMGRLVSDKGCDLLIEALVHLKARGLNPTATILGDGPEMPRLVAMVELLHLQQQVEFKGAMREGRGVVVARHRIMAIPSIWAEPFGIVALEGIAAGCVIVASDQGGLPEAGGPAGLYFPNGDVNALTAHLETLLTMPGERERLQAAGPAHLRRFQPASVAARYLELFEQLRNA
jgi:glycosyltransferase involved in cell wall biosynthesis